MMAHWLWHPVLHVAHAWCFQVKRLAAVLASVLSQHGGGEHAMGPAVP
jgi:hypothetical protein